MRGGVRYMVSLLSRKWGLTIDRWYFPYDQDGLAKARAKRSELMARYLDNDVELVAIDEKYRIVRQ